MKPAFYNERFKTMALYFLLALAVIASYKVIQEVDIIFNFIKRILRIITPFLSGFLVAYILNIPCGGIQKLLAKSKSKWIAAKKKVLGILLTYLLMFFIVYLILILVLPSISQSVSLFITNFQTYYNGAQDIINYINSLNFLDINISMEKIAAVIREFGMDLLPSSINALVGVPSALLKGFLTFISSIYILIEKDRFRDYLCKLLKIFCSSTVYGVTLKYARVLNYNFKQYIYTQTIDGFILGTIATIELVLLGSPYALTLGIMLGIVNYIPYFGSIFGSLVAIVIVAFTQGFPRAAIASVILLITQQIDGNVIQPKLMGGSFSLSPLLVIISITIGGAFYGILGMIVAIPVVAVMKNILEEVIAHHEQRKSPETSEKQQADQWRSHPGS